MKEGPSLIPALSKMCFLISSEWKQTQLNSCDLPIPNNKAEFLPAATIRDVQSKGSVCEKNLFYDVLLKDKAFKFQVFDTKWI